VLAPEVMTTLKKLGTPQGVKIYKRHGAGDNVYGVSFADLGKLQKKIKVDHALALTLFESGNMDACSLAIMIADPQKMTSAVADQWCGQMRSCLGGMFAGLIAKSPLAEAKLKAWLKSKNPAIRETGHMLFGQLLKSGSSLISDADCEKSIAAIEKSIHSAPNDEKHAMNMGLIAIGIYRPKLRTKAIAAARRIGKVEVDHGETSCKTPDAESYILKAAARGK
jgi:3-methyladenine DNA glycosylase AlkD